MKTFSDTIYADIRLEPGAALPLDTAHEGRAVYVVSGAVNIGGDRFPSSQFLVLRPDVAITPRNAQTESTRIVLVARYPSHHRKSLRDGYAAFSRARGIEIDPRKRPPDSLAFVDRAAFGVVRDRKMGTLR